MAEQSQMATSTGTKMLDPEQTAATDPGPYTTWTSRDRALLVCLLGYLCLASSLTANIYSPLIDLLAKRYMVSVQAVNLTITLFFVLQGVAPSFWSPLSDSFGRRPVYLATFAVYTLASLGLSVSDRRYPTLLLLRALQSVGGSAVMSLSYAVIADVTVHSERGRWIAPMMIATNIVPCFGPVIGGGVGIISGGFVAGRLMDWNYKKVAAAEGLPIDRKKGDDIGKFLIEKARSRGSITIILLSLGVVIGYGWLVARHVHPAALLVFQAYLGCRCTALHQTYSALIVDIFPDRPGTAAASDNITRCTLAAVAVAVLEPLTRALGYGWLFTLLGLLDALGCIAAVLALRKWGRSWRDRRTHKTEPTQKLLRLGFEEPAASAQSKTWPLCYIQSFLHR